MNWYPKDPSILKDLVPIKSCKTCAYQYGFNDLTCLECCQLSNWKEVESSLNPFNEKESEVSTESFNEGVSVKTGPCPNYLDEIDRIIAEMELSITKILNRFELIERLRK
jgi:hypothetical protein